MDNALQNSNLFIFIFVQKMQPLHYIFQGFTFQILETENTLVCSGCVES